MFENIVAVVWPSSYLILSWFFLNKKEDDSFGSVFYYGGLFQAVSLLGALTWNKASESITDFYSLIALLVVFYFSFYAYSLSYFRKLYHITKKQRTISKLRIVVVFISLLLLFWIVTLFGKFLHDNNVVESQNLYEYMHEYNTFLEFVANCKEVFSGITKTTFGFLKIGVLQLYEDTDAGDWYIFIQSIKWVYGSVILALVLNIMFNILGFGNVNITKANEE